MSRRRNARFDAEVVAATLGARGGWRFEVKHGETIDAAALVCATGFAREPAVLDPNYDSLVDRLGYVRELEREIGRPRRPEAATL